MPDESVLDGNPLITVGWAWSAMVAYLRSRWEMETDLASVRTGRLTASAGVDVPIGPGEVPWTEWVEAVRAVLGRNAGNPSGADRNMQLRP